MATKNTKITVWMVCYQLNGIPILIGVRADNAIKAGDKFVAAGFDIVDKAQIKDCCIIRTPGPAPVQTMEEFDWIGNAIFISDKPEDLRVQEKPK